MTAAIPRIPFLDMLRGLAVLGILVMNIQAFAQVELAYLNPYIQGPLSNADAVAHAIGYLFVEQKFISLFSLLFGISNWIVATNAQATGRSAKAVHWRRNLGLLLIGLVHAYLIWDGDILVAYAVAALLLTPALRWSVRRQVKTALVFLSIPLLLSLLDVWLYTPNARAELYTSTIGSIDADIAAHRGTWLEAFRWRVDSSLDMHLLGLPFYLVWFVGGLMLVGMVLFRLGIARAVYPSRFYWIWSLGWLVPGLLLTQAGYLYQAGRNFDLGTVALGRDVLAYLGALMMAQAYLGFAVLFFRGALWPGLVNVFETVGRMALTNYLLQSVVATSLFYGFGLGWYERLSLVELVPVTLAIWAMNIVVSRLWLSRFRQGPMEWFWRRLTHWSGAPAQRG